MSLIEVHRILRSKRNIMFSFMDSYLFANANVQRNNVLSTKGNFINVILFCINTRQRQVNDQRENAISYFDFHYSDIKKAISQGDWESLKDLIYFKPKDQEYMRNNGLNYPIGVGQKIGSFILEALIHYGKANPDLEPKLFVPIDTHIHHIFSECLEISVPKVDSRINSNRFKNFQKELLDNTYNNNPRIYFDYLWFIGKMFCTQKNNDNGFRLCNICWIKENCVYPNQWFA